MINSSYMSEQQKAIARMKAVDNLLTDPFDEKLIRMYLAEAKDKQEIIGEDLLTEIESV